MEFTTGDRTPIGKPAGFVCNELNTAILPRMSRGLNIVTIHK